MISTLLNRIIFVGDYGDWSSKWMDLSDDNNNELSSRELGGLKTEHDIINIRDDKFSRIIDSSEFVIRCSKFRTQSGAGQSGFRYGKKVDAVVGEGRVFTGSVSKDTYKRYFPNTDLFSILSKYMNPNLFGSDDVIYDLYTMSGIVPPKVFVLTTSGTEISFLS